MQKLNFKYKGCSVLVDIKTNEDPLALYPATGEPVIYLLDDSGLQRPATQEERFEIMRLSSENDPSID